MNEKMKDAGRLLVCGAAFALVMFVITQPAQALNQARIVSYKVKGLVLGTEPLWKSESEKRKIAKGLDTADDALKDLALSICEPRSETRVELARCINELNR